MIQKYIPNPLLVAGYKQDLRIYVLVTSVHPLRAYIFKDGLVRFSTEKYDTSDLSNLYAHLTNTSINKKAKNVAADKEVIGAGCKWSLLQLKDYLTESVGLAADVWDKLWIRMCNVCILTVMLMCHSVPKDTECCFALYGFDLMVDANLKPWMIEVHAYRRHSASCAGWGHVGHDCAGHHPHPEPSCLRSTPLLRSIWTSPRMSRHKTSFMSSSQPQA